MTAPLAPLVDRLNAAADLLEKPDGWTQGAFARDAEGHAVPWAYPEASCFCLRGAMMRAKVIGPLDDDDPASRALGFSTSLSLVKWNDSPTRTQAEVVSRLRTAASHAALVPGTPAWDACNEAVRDCRDPNA